MKVIGGSFGVSGSAFISSDNCLVIESAQRKVYRPGTKVSVVARIDSSKKFAWFSFLVGAILFSVIGGFLLGILGSIIGFALALAFSFYTDRKNILDLELPDEGKVALECTPRGVKKLIEWANQKAPA